MIQNMNLWSAQMLCDTYLILNILLGRTVLQGVNEQRFNVHALQISSIRGLHKLVFFLTRVNENNKNVPIFSVT